MTRIYKYTVPLFPGTYALQSKHRLNLLNAGQQGEEIAVWAEADTESNDGKTMVKVLFTGMEVKGPFTYLTTFTDSNGLVYHIYKEQQ